MKISRLLICLLLCTSMAFAQGKPPEHSHSLWNRIGKVAKKIMNWKSKYFELYDKYMALLDEKEKIEIEIAEIKEEQQTEGPVVEEEPQKFELSAEQIAKLESMVDGESMMDLSFTVNLNTAQSSKQLSDNGDVHYLVTMYGSDGSPKKYALNVFSHENGTGIADIDNCRAAAMSSVSDGIALKVSFTGVKKSDAYKSHMMIYKTLKGDGEGSLALYETAMSIFSINEYQNIDASESKVKCELLN